MIIQKLRDGGTIVGTMFRMVSNPAVALIAREAGLDFIMLDMEHGSYSFESLADIFTVSRTANLGSFVRVPEMSRGNVSRVLDCGADGVMMPMVESADQARALAQWAKYPPMGKRGLGSIGGNTMYRQFGDASAFMEQTNRETIAIAQIESAAAVTVIDDIATVEGIDVLLVGPYDLSVSLGCPGDLSCPPMNEAIATIAEAAGRHNKVFGMHAGDALLKQWIPHGMRLIMNSIDVSMLLSGMKSIHAAYKQPAF